MIHYYLSDEDFEIENVDVESEVYDDDDGQPTEYEEWQDYFGGDDWDHGQYDSDY